MADPAVTSPPHPRPLGGVHLVTDRTLAPGDRLLAAIVAAVAAGVAAVHVREPDLTARQSYDLVLAVRDAVAGRALLFVNDRLDVALAAGADGVQLGERSLPVAAARRAAGGRLLIGSSTHTPDGARGARSDGANLVLLGTIFPSRSHAGRAPAGVAALRHARPHLDVPLIAIGGITADNAADVIAAGADGVAVISAILAAHDPGAAAVSLVARVDAALTARRAQVWVPSR